MHPPEVTAVDPPPRRTRLRRWLPYLVVVAVVGLAGLAIGRTAGGRPGASSPAPAADLPVTTDGRITYSEGFAARAGLTIEAVAVRRVAPVVELIGTVAFDPRHVAAVGPRVPARVTELHVVVGDHVDEGAILARLESADLGTAQADVIALEARAHAASLDAERKSSLVTRGVVSERTAQLTSAEAASLQAQLDAARQRVAALGGRKARRHLGRFDLRTPIAGEVIEVDVRRGESVEASRTAIEIADPSRVWVELAVFERDLTHVSIGDVVEIVPRGDVGPPIPGTVAHVGSVLDAATRTTRVRVAVDNHDRRLHIRQAVSASLYADRLAVDAPAVPSKAIVLVDGHAAVFLATGPGEVELREIDQGARGRDWTAIGAGLVAGDRVVVDGAFALKAELSR